MTDDVATAELGRRLVAKLAPDELALFEETWRALGGRPGRRGRRREEPLGFGLPEGGEVLVTAVVSGVLTTVLADLGKDAGSRFAGLLARLRGGRRVPEPMPPLSPERLTAIRRIARARARKLGLTDEKATELADALVSELATGGARR